MYVSKSQIPVRYVETDQMGIVHHSNYAVYFEVGRTDFIEQVGMSYSEVERAGVMLPLTHLTCHYYTGARYGDLLCVETRCTKLSIARCTFSYVVYRMPEREKLCEGSTTHGFVGTDNFKPLNLKKHFPEIYKLLADSLDDGTF